MTRLTLNVAAESVIQHAKSIGFCIRTQAANTSSDVFHSEDKSKLRLFDNHDASPNAEICSLEEQRRTSGTHAPARIG